MIQMTIINTISEALRNYGYRKQEKKDNIIIFAKPMGYSIVSAKIIQKKSNFKLEMELLVKNTDGENLVWTSKKNTLENIKDNNEYYLNVVQIIMYFEADIFYVKSLHGK